MTVPQNHRNEFEESTVMAQKLRTLWMSSRQEGSQVQKPLGSTWVRLAQRTVAGSEVASGGTAAKGQMMQVLLSQGKK